jgi:hypothetical protein
MKNKLKIVHKEVSKQMMFYRTSSPIEKAINKWNEDCMNIRLKDGHHYLQFYKHSGTLWFDKRVVEKDPCTLYFSTDLLGETDDDYTVMKIRFSDMITDFIEWSEGMEDVEYAEQVVAGLKKQISRLEKHIKEIK